MELRSFTETGWQSPYVSFMITLQMMVSKSLRKTDWVAGDMYTSQSNSRRVYSHKLSVVNAVRKRGWVVWLAQLWGIFFLQKGTQRGSWVSQGRGGRLLEAIPGLVMSLSAGVLRVSLYFSLALSFPDGIFWWKYTFNFYEVQVKLFFSFLFKGCVCVRVCSSLRYLCLP